MSFRIKTILGIALIESVLLILLIVSGLKLLDTIQTDGLNKRAESTTKVLASTAKEAVLASDLATLDTFTSEIITNPEVLYIRILDANQDTLSSAGQTLKQNQQTLGVLQPSDNVIVSRSTIIVEDTLFGYVEAAYSKDELNVIYHTARVYAIAIAITELVLVALFSFFLGTYLSSKLSTLKKAAENIAHDDYSFSLKEKGSDELAQVTSAFNTMLEKLRVKKLFDETNLELIESVQHTQPGSLQIDGRIQIFDFVLDRILQLTHNQVGILLTWTDNYHEKVIRSVSVPTWTNNTRQYHRSRQFSEINIAECETTLQSVFQSRKPIFNRTPVELQLGNEPLTLDSYIVIPVTHHDQTNGLVILANFDNQYDEDFILDKNKLAWISLANLIYIDNNNQRMGIVQQRIEKQNSFITSIYESIPDAIISISKMGKITSLNKAVCDIFGYTQDELLGENVSILMPEPYRSMHDSYLYNFNHSSTQENNTILSARELISLSKTGELIPIEITINHIDDPEGDTSYVGIIKDITRQKKQIEEIKYANRLATQSYVDRYHFISVLNEIVLNPALLLNTEIQSTLAGQSMAGDKNAIDDISELSYRLEQNAQNIVYYTNLVSGNFRLKKHAFTMEQLTREIKADILQINTITPENLTCKVLDASATAYYHDHKHLGLVITRLIQHLVYRHAHFSSLELNIQKTGETGKKDRIEFTISIDNISGVTDQSRSNSDDMELKVASLMLGFLRNNPLGSLSDNLTISGQNNDRVTIRFKMDLTRAAISQTNVTSSCGTVLLVDDDEQVLKLTQMMLENIGFAVDTANNGQQAIDKFIDQSYTAIFIDCGMPVMDGYEATQVIRGYEESRYLTNTPIIATTGQLENEELKHCLISGMNDYIIKPFTIDQLLIKTGLHIPEVNLLKKNVALPNSAFPAPASLNRHFVNKTREHLSLISQCLTMNNWQALKYSLSSLQNMSLAMGYMNINELAIQIDYQSKLSDQSAIEETLLKIESVLSAIQEVNYNKNQRKAAGED